MSETMPKLKPCPFCGATGRKVRTTLHWRSWDVKCCDCGCSTGCYDMEMKAVAAWNKRMDDGDMKQNRLK